MNKLDIVILFNLLRNASGTMLYNIMYMNIYESFLTNPDATVDPSKHNWLEWMRDVKLPNAILPTKGG